jgi:putative ABC transport system permease protein
VAAGIVVAGSVTNRVLARRRDIGLLKAVGVTPRQVVGMIAVEHLVLAAVGLVLGWLLAYALTPSLRVGVTEVLDAGARSVAAGPSVVAAIALAVIVLLATVLPASRVGRTSTAAALQPPAGGAGRSRIARLAVSAGAGPVAVSGLKDAFGRPLRSALAASSIVLAIMR